MGPGEDLLLWRYEGSSAEDRRAFLAALKPALLSSNAAPKAEWESLGCGLVASDASELSLPGADFARLPVPGNAVAADEAKGFFEIAAPALPAPPLALKSRQPVSKGFVLELSFKEDLNDEEKTALGALFLHFATAYDVGEDSVASFQQHFEARRATFTMKTTKVEDAELRGHAYWLVENVDRFWSLERADFLGGAKAKRGLRPSWLGPVITMGAALAFARFASGPDAARGSLLALLFLPLIFNFLSRDFVSKATWLAAAVNALGVGIVAALVENPSLLWPPPEPPTAESLAALQERLVTVVYLGRSLCLLWVIPYLRSGRRQK